MYSRVTTLHRHHVRAHMALELVWGHLAPETESVGNNRDVIAVLVDAIKMNTSVVSFISGSELCECILPAGPASDQIDEAVYGAEMGQLQGSARTRSGDDSRQITLAKRPTSGEMLVISDQSNLKGSGRVCLGRDG